MCAGGWKPRSSDWPAGAGCPSWAESDLEPVNAQNKCEKPPARLPARRARSRVKRLNGMDAMLLYSETPNLHTHTLKVAVIDPSDFEGEFGFDVFRHHVRRRLHLLE